jgi:hypothetical protein
MNFQTNFVAVAHRGGQRVERGVVSAVEFLQQLRALFRRHTGREALQESLVGVGLRIPKAVLVPPAHRSE